MVSREHVLAWAERKMGRKTLTIKQPRTVEVEHKRALGGRGEYAKIVLRASPAESFAFTSAVDWPDGDDYDQYVLDGLLDQILADDVGPAYARIAFSLESIAWHEIDSCGRAFYAAARKAVSEVIGPGLDNVDFELT